MTLLWRTLAHATFAALLLGGTSCGPESTSHPDGTTSSITRGELDGLRFLLESSVGFAPLAGTTVSLSFREGELSVNAGCNHLGGSFQIRNASLVVTELGGTEIGCDAARHAQDEWLASFVTARPRIARDGSRLTLTGSNATLTFLDREVADPDQALAGAAWSIDTLIKGDAASNYPSPKDPTLTFHADGTLEVDTTCNTSRGNYTVSGNTLTLSNIAYTEKACSSPASFVEEHVQAVVFDGSVTFSIDARRLTIARGDVGLSAMRDAAGNDDGSTGTLTVEKLDGLHYLLDSAEGFTPVAGSKIHLLFNDGELSFSAGCNGHFGAFALRDDKVIIEGFGSTLRGCPKDQADQDDWLAAFFTSQPRVVQSGERLIFTGSDASLNFLDREIADPDQPLAGARWSIDTFIKGDAAMSGSSPGANGAPTITFRDDGTVHVFASCNNAQGDYAVQGDTITFTGLAYTEKGCSEAASLEAHVQAVVTDGNATFEIEAGRLTLTRGDLGLSATRP